MARDEKTIQPFLKNALEKAPEDRSFFEKLGVGIYGPGIEARKDRDKPAAILDENYKDFVEELPSEVALASCLFLFHLIRKTWVGTLTLI